uniref:SUN domain-containing protein 2-like isoform X2 n=1 Tax=Ciona intestinalis TaxID=7719 RepID=UPI00089DB970|nr:SUN domain-containing protein 2-like isoform X2 [Ciona intestinalis]|eukprot:XP_018671224.1 SUN domain-containing protein 2-like isoform X2 [Ciona intestinalis]
MSRTSITGASRRSKRLVESGYYVFPNELEGTASEDDDTMSVDSDMSERRVKYSGGSPVHRPFNWRKKRNPSGSPVRSPNAGIPESASARSVLIKKQVTRRTGVTKVLSASSTHQGQSVYSAASAPVVQGSMQMYGSEGGAHGSTAPHHFAMGESSNHRHQTSGFTATSYHEGDSQGSIHQTHTAVAADSNFKMPGATVAHRRKKLHETHEEEQQIVTDMEHSFSDDETLPMPRIKEHGKVKHGVERNQLLLFRIFVLFYQIFCSCGTIIANTVWNIGRFLYQSVTKVLVLDTWLLSRKAPRFSFFQTTTKFLRALLVLLGVLCACFACYSYLSRKDLGIQKGLNKQTYWDRISAYSDPTVLFETYTKSKLADNGPTLQMAKHDRDALKQAIENIELALGQLEVRVADRHSNLLDQMQIMHASHAKDIGKLGDENKEVVKSVKNMVESSVVHQLVDVTALFDEKLLKLQDQIHLLKENGNESLEKLKLLIQGKETSLSSETQNVLSHVKRFEDLISSLDEKIVQLKLEHSVFKSSIESKSGNVSYIKEVADDRFVENFLQLLQSTTKLNKPSNRRYQHLAAVFIQWLQMKGFMDEQSILVLQNNIIKNTSSVAVELNKELERKLRKEQPKRSTVTLDTIIPKQQSTPSTPSTVTEVLVKTWIKESLDIYSADRIGMGDFALESSGGYIVNTRCSTTFQQKTALVTLFGIPIYYNTNTPRAVIQSSVMPGECWAFQGSEGYVVIGLSASVQPDSFTLEHIPQALALYSNITSAPKDFSVYGLHTASEINGDHLGSYRYEENGSPIQNFKVEAKKSDQTYRFIELRVASNWGNPHFTCIYRFRVHGTKVDDTPL